MFETTWRRFVAAVLLRPLSGWRTGDNPGRDDDHCGGVGVGDDGQGVQDLMWFMISPACPPGHPLRSRHWSRSESSSRPPRRSSRSSRPSHPRGPAPGSLGTSHRRGEIWNKSIVKKWKKRKRRRNCGTFVGGPICHTTPSCSLLSRYSIKIFCCRLFVANFHLLQSAAFKLWA